MFGRHGFAIQVPLAAFLGACAAGNRESLTDARSELRVLDALASAMEPASGNGTRVATHGASLSREVEVEFPRREQDRSARIDNARQPVAFSVRADFWVPSVHGDVTIGAFDNEVNVDGSEAFGAISQGKYGLMIGGDAQFDGWSITLDFLNVNWEDEDAESGVQYDLFFRQENIELLAGLDLSRDIAGEGRAGLRLEPLAGVRAQYLEGKIEEPSTGIDQEDNTGFFELVIGARAVVPLSDSWIALGKATVGGFDIGNAPRYSIDVKGSIEWRWTEALGLELGYRLFAMDFEQSGFREDLTLAGPFAGLTLRF